MADQTRRKPLYLIERGLPKLLQTNPFKLPTKRLHEYLGAAAGVLRAHRVADRYDFTPHERAAITKYLQKAVLKLRAAQVAYLENVPDSESVFHDKVNRLLADMVSSLGHSSPECTQKDFASKLERLRRNAGRPPWK